MIAVRKELKEHIEGLTFLPFFMKAISLAMQEFPEINSVVNPALDSEGLI